MSRADTLDELVKKLDLRRERVLKELHPELRRRVTQVYIECLGMLTPYCGYRGPQQQQAAKAKGHSNAVWGESPHNYAPALACDLVLHPGVVRVRERPDAPGILDLWDDASPQALLAWARLEHAAAKHGLQRVDLRDGVRDRPHVQLFGWRKMTQQ